MVVNQGSVQFPSPSYFFLSFISYRSPHFFLLFLYVMAFYRQRTVGSVVSTNREFVRIPGDSSKSANDPGSIGKECLHDQCIACFTVAIVSHVL